jgi:hypothetical protein
MMEMQNATYTPSTGPSTGADKKGLAASAYQNFERAYRLQSHDQEKRILISQLATSALEAGEVQKAQVWALEALDDTKNAKSDWSVADSVHHAHIILGRIALRSGDLTEAKELLEKGERDAVIDYFQKCASFWKNDRGQLMQWAATVREGGIPNFGANLAY